EHAADHAVAADAVKGVARGEQVFRLGFVVVEAEFQSDVGAGERLGHGGSGERGRQGQRENVLTHSCFLLVAPPKALPPCSLAGTGAAREQPGPSKPVIWWRIVFGPAVSQNC